MITLNFLWHQHQPDYRHPLSGHYVLPWVRLHAVKGYQDLLTILEQYESLASTVNFSGILLEQLDDYAAGTAVDTFAQLSVRDAAGLTLDERVFVLTHFFSGNPRTLIGQNARYRELKTRRDNLVQRDGMARAAELFSVQELTDLLVWFNLAWIGFTGQRRSEVMELVTRGRDFTPEHQQAVLQVHQDIIKGILPGYKRLAGTTDCELSFTPYQHPILPLIVDLAGLGTPGADDPLPEFSYPADAQEQVKRGMEQYQRCFGISPRGVWPAEGSVSDAVLDIFASSGLVWAATDQQNLPHAHGGSLAHLQPHCWRGNGGSLRVFFRDTRLADNIGFEYAGWPGAVAGGHLVSMARAAARQSGLDQPVITIALDGENPWENYPDGGQSFLRGLAEAVAVNPDITCRTPGRILCDGDHPMIHTVSAGSWIGGNFDIWSRHSETRVAWRRLATARRELIDVARGPVLDHLLVAEGSDWFWWFGDDFDNEQGRQFDELFRAHLIAAYEAAGRTVPNELYAPIMAEQRPETVDEVSSLIEPVLDGRVSTYYEWRGAVRLEAGYGQGSMARSSSGGITALWYGFSEESLYLRLELDEAWLAAARRDQVAIQVNLAQAEREFSLSGRPCRPGDSGPGTCECAVDRIVECRMGIDSTGVTRGELAYLSVQLTDDAGMSVNFPESGRVPLHVITRDYAVAHWSV